MQEYNPTPNNYDPISFSNNAVYKASDDKKMQALSEVTDGAEKFALNLYLVSWMLRCYLNRLINIFYRILENRRATSWQFYDLTILCVVFAYCDGRGL